MVASISARGGVQAALSYYAHLGHDDYYLREDGPPGRWAGEGAALLGGLEQLMLHSLLLSFGRHRCFP